jgi:penicillin-binding protein 1A
MASLSRKSLALIGLAVVLGIVSGWLFSRLANLPHVEDLETYHPSEVSRIFADDGTLLDELFIERRDVVPFDQIPPQLKEAVIAVEDSRFYTHHGIDFRGIGRALLKNIQAGGFVQGGSTISQQLSKVLFFTPEKTLTRKIKEAILTIQIEKRYTKDQILDLYLNQIYLGNGCYGVQTASKRYLGKKVSDITLAEAALLAALPKSPARYSPVSHPEEAMARRNHVLDRMGTEGFISEEAMAEAKAEPLPTHATEEMGERAPYFVQMIIQDLESRLGKETLYQGGLAIHTTLNTSAQQLAQNAVREGLDRISARSPQKESSHLQGALIALDPSNGHIKAMVGGYDFSVSQFNRAVQAKRQPGSAFKPVIYAAALEKGFNASDVLLDTPMVYTDPRSRKKWRPQNFSHEFSGTVTLRRALEKSLNVPTVRLLQDLGIEYSIDLARRLGIRSRLNPYLSLALGTSEVSLLELSAAYGAFAAQGVYSKPIGITRVYDRNGRLLERHEPEQQIALDEESAYLITYLLQGVVQSGTGQVALALERPVAAKTGTTDDYSDAWFVGYTPELVAGAWVGYDDRLPIGPGETGARAAGPIWLSFMQGTLKHKAPAYFPVPSSLVFRRVDAVTGEPASPTTMEVIDEAFRKDRLNHLGTRRQAPR